MAGLFGVRIPAGAKFFSFPNHHACLEAHPATFGPFNGYREIFPQG
jgi:hypothetical protein